MKLLDFLNFIQPELLVAFLASFINFLNFINYIEFIRQKSRFSQFWTFMPIISNLLENLKISIMPPKNLQMSEFHGWTGKRSGVQVTLHKYAIITNLRILSLNTTMHCLNPIQSGGDPLRTKLKSSDCGENHYIRMVQVHPGNICNIALYCVLQF